jgi:hypothetical protein
MKDELGDQFYVKNAGRRAVKNAFHALHDYLELAKYKKYRL